jgi:glycyl-tRNA synthetase beta chain
MATKKSKIGGTETLLVELLTEELPPKTLRALSEAFGATLAEDLRQDDFLEPESEARVFATPRRLAVQITCVRGQAPDKPVELSGPSVKVGLDASGNPTPALLGFARKYGVDVAKLVRRQTPKGEFFFHRDLAKGGHLDTNLEVKVQAALNDLPVPKIMRWGEGNAEFVRPVHGLVMLHGSHVVPGEVLGRESTNQTSGHRFLGATPIKLKHADDYERVLRGKGNVIASFTARRDDISKQLADAAGDAALVADDALLDEITALVEAPAVYAGEFSTEFLAVPEECLILSMQQHQKYVPLRDKVNGNLLPRFLFVANLSVKDPSSIVQGNERVLRARLADAKFFYDQDRKQRLEARVPRLAQVVYHNKLGSQLERVERIQLLAGRIARDLGADPLLAERAAWLSKADLLTEMVGEFPELQGIMGAYYASHDGEDAAVVEAIRDQYRTKRDDADPENLVSVSLYLSDRIEALIGLFGIGEAPTGEKDPFGLRRAALGTIRAFELIGAMGKLTDKDIPDVRDFLMYGASLFPAGLLSPKVIDQVHDFILERYWNNLATVFRMDKSAVDAVISQRPKLMEVKARVDAVQMFRLLPEAESLATANKRIRNILKKSDAAQGGLDEMLLKESAEKALYDSMKKIEPQAESYIQQRDYARALTTLAAIRGAVDRFFNDVLVNTEDSQLRANRHALLRRLDALMNQVADISKLAVEK